MVGIRLPPTRVSLAYPGEGISGDYNIYWWGQLGLKHIRPPKSVADFTKMKNEEGKENSY